MDVFGEINVTGAVTLNSNGTSEIKNVYIERLSDSAETTLAATLGMSHYGRLIFNTTIGGIKFWTGSKFMQIGVGDAALTQNQLELLKSALGSFVNVDGSFNESAFAAFTTVGKTATNLLDVLTDIDRLLYTTSTATISSLADTSITAPTAAQVLRYNGNESRWKNAQLFVGDLAGVVVSNTEVNLLQGLTTPLTTQLSSIQSSIANAVSIANGAATEAAGVTSSINLVGQNLSTVASLVGLTGTSALPDLSATTYLNLISSITDGLVRLDTAIAALKTTLSGSTGSTQVTVPFTSAATITVLHNLKNQYSSVIVVDSTNKTITPSSITYTDANSLQIVLPIATSGTVIVSRPGIPA